MKKANSHTVLSLARGGLIAALYAAATLAAYPISFGAVQFRISEALCVLPMLFPEAVPALFVGCVVSGFFSPNAIVLDAALGSLATLAAAALTRKLRRKPVLAVIPPVLINAVVVGAVIAYSVTGIGAGFGASFLYNMLTVGAGQVVSCCALGLPLYRVLKSSGLSFLNGNAK